MSLSREFVLLNIYCHQIPRQRMAPIQENDCRSMGLLGDTVSPAQADQSRTRRPIAIDFTYALHDHRTRMTLRT